MSTVAAWLASLLTATGLLLGGIATYRQSRATARKSVADIQGEALDRLDVRLERAETRIEKLESDLDAERRHSAQQDQQIQRLRNRWRSWYTDLVDRWPHHRQSALAPAPPALD